MQPAGLSTCALLPLPRQPQQWPGHHDTALTERRVHEARESRSRVPGQALTARGDRRSTVIEPAGRHPKRILFGPTAPRKTRLSGTWRRERQATVRLGRVESRVEAPPSYCPQVQYDARSALSDACLPFGRSPPGGKAAGPGKVVGTKGKVGPKTSAPPPGVSRATAAIREVLSRHRAAPPPSGGYADLAPGRGAGPSAFHQNAVQPLRVAFQSACR